LRHCLFSALLASILLFPAARAKAIDLATAGLIVEGVGFVTSALEKPQPNLTLEIVQRNRTLLIGMNTKLDQLGENLIKLYAGGCMDACASRLIWGVSGPFSRGHPSATAILSTSRTTVIPPSIILSANVGPASHPESIMNRPRFVGDHQLK